MCRRPTARRASTIPKAACRSSSSPTNAREFGIEYFNELDPRQGIVHIIGPEQGFTLPGTTIVCGDSHTSTHGAFGALAHGIGTSEVEHVLATQTLIQAKAKNMRVTRRRQAPEGVTAKDIVLAIIGEIGTAGGTGHVIEYRRRSHPRPVDGRPHDGLQHVDRGRRPRRHDRARRKDLRLSRRAGRWRRRARPGMQADAPLGRRCIPTRAPHFDKEIRLDAGHLPPIVTWGTSPEDVIADHRRGAAPRGRRERGKRASIARALDYMGLKGGEKITDIAIDRVFIGSCTNGRIEDLRAAAKIVEGKKVAERVNAMVVPGSGLVKQQAEAEGLDADLHGRRASNGASPAARCASP